MIWGENGSGKTSVLEAIHLLTYGKSFKTHKQTQLIKEGKKNALLKAVFLKKKIKIASIQSRNEMIDLVKLVPKFEINSTKKRIAKTRYEYLKKLNCLIELCSK